MDAIFRLSEIGIVSRQIGILDYTYNMWLFLLLTLSAEIIEHLVIKLMMFIGLSVITRN